MAQEGISANRLELLQIAESVAMEKAIDKSIVIEAMADAIQRAAKARYGGDHDIRADVNPETGEVTLQRLLLVSEGVENVHTEIGLSEARERNPAACVGDYIAEDLPPVEFGRVQAQNAKQVIVHKVREAERARHYEEFKDRIGEIVNGVVKREEFGHVAVIDLGRAEAVLRRNERLPRERFESGERVRAYVYDVRREAKGPQIFLSRTHPQFMAKLFAQEVPEIYDGVVEIVAVARDPGSRAKIAVTSRDPSVDPVGACVGMRGSRVQAVVAELNGEKVDIVPWSPDAATFVVNALAPAGVSKVVLDEDNNRIEVVVPDDQLALTIGRRGQSVRLASQLTGWNMDIIPESEDSVRRQEAFARRSALFSEALEAEEATAQLLASEGFASVEDVAYVESSEISALEGFDDEKAERFQRRAREWLALKDEEYEARRKELGVEDGLKEIDGLTPAMLAALGEEGILTLDDFAGCASDDLVGWTERNGSERVRHEGILGDRGLSRPAAEAMILRARIACGMIEPEPEAEASADGEGGEDVEGGEGGDGGEDGDAASSSSDA